MAEANRLISVADLADDPHFTQRLMSLANAGDPQAMLRELLVAVVERLSAAIDHDATLFGDVLRNMREGVMTLDLEGRIVTFNPAAERFLGLKAAEAIGAGFAEMFFGDERNDAFNQFVLNAIYDTSRTHGGDVAFHSETQDTELGVTTSLLTGRAPVGDDDKRGVIIVMSDITERRKAERIRDTFGKYVDPRIVESLIDRPDVGGEKRVMTISFADMQGFTSLSERLGPTELVALLNEYFTLMSEPVADQHGVVDKFMGDAVMAFWGPPFTPHHQQAQAACLAALDQRAKVTEWAADLRRRHAMPEDAPPIDIRCGVATGEVVVGSIGSAQSRNFTVLGDSANLASRLEGANKALGVRLLAADATRMMAGDAVEARDLGDVQVVGKREFVRVHELMARKGELTDQQGALREHFERGMTRWRDAAFVEAAEAFEASLAVMPEDGPAQKMLQRCQELIESPPGEEWTPGLRLVEK